MRQYLNLLQDVLDNGVVKNDRTGVGTLSVFGRQARFSLAAGFPLLTTKKLHWKSIVHELLWFLRGDTNIAYLQSAGVSIWDEWADENGDMGPIYGRQWRAWPTDNGAIDQIYKVIDALRNNPDSRRIIVCAWKSANCRKCGWRRVMSCFNFMSPTASCRVSYINAAPICFWACLSTSPLMRY